MPDNGVLTLAQRGGDPSAPAVGYSSIFTTGSGIYQIDPLGTVERLGGTQQNDVLYSETLSGSGIFDVTGISQDYDILQIRASLRTDQAVSGDECAVYYNNDTAANYNRSWHYFNQVAHAGGGSTSPNSVFACGSSAAANTYSTVFGEIFNYKGGNIKISFYRSNLDESSTRNTNWFSQHSWASTSAINRITIQPDGYSTNNFVAGSYLEIIGVKNL